ncbi:MAG: hypothetical protein JWO33_707 [Caulobacteraceae bacterium]|nr:hypothetical protein [Caulobacteraceae bacterium]
MESAGERNRSPALGNVRDVAFLDSAKEALHGDFQRLSVMTLRH